MDLDRVGRGVESTINNMYLKNVFIDTLWIFYIFIKLKKLIKELEMQLKDVFITN